VCSTTFKNQNVLTVGYEVKVIIGYHSGSEDEMGRKWFNPIATYDLCKVSLNCSGIKDSPGHKLLDRNDTIKIQPIYYYGDDGNTRIEEDRYGADLVAFDPEILLKELKEQAAMSDYRRFPPLIAMLESLLQQSWSEGLTVVLFGH